MIKKFWYVLIGFALLVGACTPTSPSTVPTTSASETVAPSTAPTGTNTPVENTLPLVITATAQPATETPAPTATPSQATATTSSGGGSEPPYVDNRSSGSDLMISFVNALNRKEYVRAYSYWQSGAANLPPYDQFAQGYANTASVQLKIGEVTLGAAAGNLYWAVPVVMIAKTTSGGTQTFVGCYVVHLGQPANYGAPPFIHTDIQSATVKQVANSSDTNGPLASACQESGMTGSPLQPQPTYAPGDVGAARYLDDLSGPVEELRSYFNAINRKEYVRAYTYWQSGSAASQLPSYDQFATGYQDTASVQLTTGQVASDAGAGQVYYSVPVTLAATTTAGAAQTFVGCYKLHQAQPANFGAPPFQPLGIISASIKQVANGSDTASLMSQACP